MATGNGGAEVEVKVRARVAKISIDDPSPRTIVDDALLGLGFPELISHVQHLPITSQSRFQGFGHPLGLMGDPEP
jgi:hypothetical protein